MMTAPFLDHVVHIVLVEVVGFERVIDQVRPFHVPGSVEALDPRQFLGGPHPVVREIRVVVLLVHLEVNVPLQLASDVIGFGILGTFSCAGPEIINGVRASSIRILSTSSMMA